MSLKDQRILIVGGGSGIGYAVAEGCLADGATVVIASTGAERLEVAAKALGPGASIAVLDLTDEAGLAAYFKDSGGFDHIVTTAGDWGGPRRVPLAELDLQAARSVFEVRFWGALALAKHGAFTLGGDGSITFTDGMVGQRPAPTAYVSSAMAGAVEYLARALAVELAPIRVNAVSPGLIRTGRWDTVPDDRMAEMTKNQLIPRIGTATEAAQAYLFLLRCGYTTGQVINVEGGMR